MRVPGANLLAMALTVIGPQSINYYAQTGRVLLDDGVWSTGFAVGVTTTNLSVQAVDRALYEAMGLDYQKSYKWLYIPQTIVDLQRDVSGDRFGFAGRKYQLQSGTDWQPMDGWNAVLCVDIGIDNGIGGAQIIGSGASVELADTVDA